MCKGLRIVTIYISAFMLIFSQSLPAYAGLIGTEKFILKQQNDQDRETLKNLFNREEAKSILESYGVTPKQAQKRINNLTEIERIMLVQKLEDMPAGGVGAIAALLIIVLLFIALDLSGKTDVFNDL